MKKNILLSLFLLIALVLPGLAQADGLATQLKGRILLQVEQNGEAWYINPENEERYFLGRPADAFNLMRTLGLGVSNADFSAFGDFAPTRLAGRILLKVEASGEAYYINPLDLKMYYLGRPEDAFQVMRELGLGISNGNLSRIGVRAGHDVSDSVAAETEEVTGDEEEGSGEQTIEQVEEPEDSTETATTTEETTGSEEQTATTTEEVVSVPEVFPCEFQAEYFDNEKLLSWPRLTQTEEGINHDWWTNKPDGFNYRDEFSVRWVGDCEFAAGKHKFTAEFNDGMRVYVDDELIVDEWTKRVENATREAELNLTAGNHEVKVEYFEGSAAAVAKLSWEGIE